MNPCAKKSESNSLTGCEPCNFAAMAIGTGISLNCGAFAA